MIEFINGSDEQYDELKDSLNDHLCHVYKNCCFPLCCSKTIGRIGFEKDDKSYILYIDKEITCSGNNVPDLFMNWLSNGYLRFLDFTDMKEFLKSLICLY